MSDDNKEVAVEDVEEQPTETKKEGVSMGKVHISDAQVPMVLMFFCAIILLVAVLVPGKYGNQRRWAYSVSVASVSMFFSLVGFCLTFSSDLNEKIGKYNAYFLFVWNFVGACVLTFGGPFLTTSNGYFAAWGLVIASMLAVGVTGVEAKSVVGRMGALLGMGAASVVVIIAVIPEISGFYRNESIYSLVVACCSILVVIVYQKLVEGGGMVKFCVLALFAILWIVQACFVTFKGPFLTTSNGYFGSWGGAITSVVAAMAALKEKE